MLDELLDIFYLRLSLEDGDTADGITEESASISSQRTCLQRFATQHFPSVTFQEVIDDGYSGTNMDRPGMQQLLQWVASGKVRTVIVRDLSRFARNYIDAGYYLEYVFPAYHVRFISVNDGYDSAQLVETTGGLNLALRNILNEMYSRDISRKIKSVVDMKKMQGEFVYGTAPFGYQKGPTKNTVIVDPVASPIVQNIFAWAAGGLTVTQIAQRLNDSHTVTPSEYLASRRGKCAVRPYWTYESVHHILRNRFYTGDTVPFKSHVVKIGSNHVKCIPEEQRIVIPNTHEPLISHEQFNIAQRTVRSVRKTPTHHSANPLKSTLICACCGNHLNKGKDSNKTWLCATARYQSRTACGAIRMDDAKIQDVVLHALTNQCRLLDVRLQQVAKEKRENCQKQQDADAELRKLQVQLRTLQADNIRSYEAYVSGALSKDIFLTKKAERRSREETLKQQIDLTKKSLEQLQAISHEQQRQEDEAAHFIPLKDSTVLTQPLVKDLIRKITVYPDQRIFIEWNFSDEIKALLTPVSQNAITV